VAVNYGRGSAKVFDEAVSEVFLTSQKQPGKAVFDAVERKFKRNQRSVDELHTKAHEQGNCLSLAHQLDYKLVQMAREGKAVPSESCGA